MKIAVCVDDSKVSRRALENAVDFTEQSDAELVILHSVSTDMVYNMENELVKEAESAASARGEELVNRLCKKAQKQTESRIDISGAALSSYNSDPVSAIINYIKDKDIEHVFIGHRSLDEKHEKLFGSFAKDVISESPIPVTVTTSNSS